MDKTMKWANPLVTAALIFLLFAAPLRAADVGRRIHFKLSAGMVTSGDGDLASMIRGMDEYHQDLATMWGKTKTGTLEWPKTGRLLGGEVEMDLSRNFSICLGLDVFSKGREQSLRLTPDPEMNMNGNCRITVIPLSLYAVIRFPLNERFQVFLKGGPSYAWMKNRTEYRLASGIGWWEEKTGRIQDAAFGLQGGAGVEFKISKTISLTAEGLARWMKFTSWTGEYDRINSDGRTDHIAGPVWFEEVMWDTGKYYPEVVIGEKEVPHPTRSIREFQIDFSGLAIKIGLKVRLPW